MISDLKNIYHEKYEELCDHDLMLNNRDENLEIDMPKGWSIICLNETINYYKEYMDKE